MSGPSTGRALGYSRLGAEGRAERLYREAVKVSPRDAVLRFNLSLAIARQGRPEEALREIDSSAGRRTQTPPFAAQRRCSTPQACDRALIVPGASSSRRLWVMTTP